MTDPDDAELSALLRKGRSAMRSPSREFKTRVIRVYKAHFAARDGWRQFFSRRFAVPVPVGVFAVVTLLGIGFALGAKFRFSTHAGEVVQSGPLNAGSTPTNAIAGGKDSRVLGGFQVVAELRPRLIGGADENR